MQNVDGSDPSTAQLAHPAASAVPSSLEHLVQGYLATLGATSASTQRQRAWALRELLTHLGPSSSVAALSPQHVRSWLDAAATADPPASLPGLRARASAVRALAQHATDRQLLAASAVQALAPVLRMPAPPLVPGPRPDPVRRLLVVAHPDRRPLAVHPAVWTRFCAHVHLLALTGEREDVVVRLQLADVVAPTSPTGPHLPREVTPRPAHISHSEDGADSCEVDPSISHDAPAESHIDGEAVTPPLFADHLPEAHTHARQEVAPLDDTDDTDDLEDIDGARQAEDLGTLPADGDLLRDWQRAKEVAEGVAQTGGGSGGSGEGGDAGRRGAGVADPVVDTRVRIHHGLAPRSWPLPEPARTALRAWIADRAVLVALLQGSDPGALWLRVRPSSDLRTGALRPAGLPLSDRGLRLAFTTTLAVLALEDRELAELSTSAVRAYARGRGPL